MGLCGWCNSWIYYLKYFHVFSTQALLKGIMFIILETLADHVTPGTDPVYKYAEPEHYFPSMLQAEKYVLSQANDPGAFTNTEYKIVEIKKFTPSKVV